MATTPMELINMWKQILKVDMQEARRLGNKYSEQDMTPETKFTLDSDNKWIQYGNKIDKFVKENLYDSMSKDEQGEYSWGLEGLRASTTPKEANKYKTYLQFFLRRFDIMPRRL